MIWTGLYAEWLKFYIEFYRLERWIISMNNEKPKLEEEGGYPEIEIVNTVLFHTHGFSKRCYYSNQTIVVCLQMLTLLCWAAKPKEISENTLKMQKVPKKQIYWNDEKMCLIHITITQQNL